MIFAFLLAQLLPIYGHRGMVQEAPEDTLPAYRLCLEEGIGIEVDVRLTRDGVPIVIHDVTVDRTTNGTGRVDALTLAEIKRLDAGSWFNLKFRDARVPTLEEVLQLVRAVDRAGITRVVIDQKELAPGVEHLVLELLRRYDLVQRSFVLCKEVGMLARFKHADPTIRTSAIVDRRDDIEPLLSRPEVDIVWLSKRVPGVLAASEVLRINAQGKRVVHFIAEREEDRWRAAVAGGADGIITDFARQAKAALHPATAKP
jgi:glycerophosphoryl diester phosphodiesterase